MFIFVKAELFLPIVGGLFVSQLQQSFSEDFFEHNGVAFAG